MSNVSQSSVGNAQSIVDDLDQLDPEQEPGQENGYHEQTIVRRPELTPEQDALASFDTNHAGNAKAVEYLTDDRIKFSEEYGWYVWTGTHWEHNKQKIKDVVSDVLTVRKSHGIAIRNDDLINSSEANRENISGTMYMLETYRDTEASFFDSDPDMLPAPNGLIDLRTGKRLPHDKTKGFSYTTTVEYEQEADYSEWVAFLESSVEGDTEVIEALQIWSGYMLTGRTDSERMAYLWGPGGSGKSTYAESIMNLLPQPVSQTRGFGTMTAKRAEDTQNFDLASLERARILHANESQRQVELNGALLKNITSGQMFATYKGKQGFRFDIKFKTMLTSNWEVNLDADDSAGWSRIVPFHFPIERRDSGLENPAIKRMFQTPEQQKGILRWAVEGAVKYYERGGLYIPDALQSDKQRQRDKLDKVGSWLEENTARKAGYATCSASVISNYEQWCKHNAVEPKRAKSFTQAMERHGYENPDRMSIGDTRCRAYKDLVLTADYEPADSKAVSHEMIRVER